MPTIKAQLKAIHQEGYGYLTYVFQNLEATTWDTRYKTLVRFPNWESIFPSIGDIGYLEYKEVTAGDDYWWDVATNSKVAYNYDNIIFIDFIREPQEEQTVLL